MTDFSRAVKGDFSEGMEMDILINFYDVEDRTGGHRLIMANHIDIACYGTHPDLAQYRSGELLCTVPIRLVNNGEVVGMVDLNDEMRRVLLEFHNKYPHVSAEHWLSCAA